MLYYGNGHVPSACQATRVNAEAYISPLSYALIASIVHRSQREASCDKSTNFSRATGQLRVEFVIECSGETAG